MLSMFLIVCLLGSALADVYRIGLNKEVKVLRKETEANANGQRVDYVALDHVYIGTVSLGTPLQDVNVAFDTESGIFWVPDNKCACDVDCLNEQLCFDMCSSHCCSKGGGNSTLFEDDGNNTAPVGVCTHKNVYNPKESNTYISRRTSTVEPFLNKKITINLAYETFRFGPHHAGGFTMNYLQFGHASDLPEAYEDAQFDGVFGLGRVGPRGSKAPIKQLADKRVISNPVVTLSLKDGKDSKDVYDGVLTVGQIDETYCELGPSKFLPVASANKWNFRVFKAQLGTKTLQDLTWTARIDPSWPFITIPQKVWEQVVKTAVTEDRAGHYTGSCGTLRSIFSTISIYMGNEVQATPYTRVLVEYSTGLCELLVQPAGKDTDQWVLGTPFLTNRCLALDYNGRIGIGKFP
ncbi:unnamed protein product [Bursaphelenchus xylophilus]|uniref:(pine wood nematode) hypothetical protein n=1 Tax=Bursaphelenchus xylophilus TaxID=6326 RepID=A0A1I7SE39_BURXY|nr:unnamed protein product [Bursaphelenchus xylophilus]CAG9104227.1 unnamed protein product [Bursaphelenchus xylophilus]